METRKTTGLASAEKATLVAQLRSESRLNPDHFQAFALGFVLDEALKLKKAPVAYPIVHTLSKPSSPYSLEVFQHYFVSIKTGNYLLAYVVINPSHEPLFSSAYLLKKAFSRASAFSLKNRTQMLKLSLGQFDFGRVKELAIARNSEIVNSEINAKFSRNAVNGISPFREPKQEETFAFSIDTQEALSQLPAFEVFSVTGRNFDTEFLPTFKQPQSKNIAFKTGRTWEIVADRSSLNYGLALGSLNNAASMLDTSYSKLSRQRLSQLLVNKWVKLNIIPDSTIPSLVNAELQSLTVSLNSSNHFIGSDDFDLGNSTPNHTQQQKNTTLNTLAGHLSSVQCPSRCCDWAQSCTHDLCFLQKNRKVYGNITTQSPQAAEYQRK